MARANTEDRVGRTGHTERPGHFAQQRPQDGPPLLSRKHALFLDFDGTLADIAPRPDEVAVVEELPWLLESLCGKLGGAAALLTGRRLCEVDGYLALALAGAGLHGAELRMTRNADSRLQWRPDTEGRAARLRQRFATDPRVVVEDKGAAVALHYRQAPERANECCEAMDTLFRGPEFEIVLGSMVVEARPRGANKGRALQTFMAQPPFAGRTPVVVGDDITDEDGFEAAAALGGYGVKVGTGPTHARYRCLGVADVHAWLQASLKELDA
jgi:trehalose 6-phosphate phosphatase